MSIPERFLPKLFKAAGFCAALAVVDVAWNRAYLSSVALTECDLKRLVGNGVHGEVTPPPNNNPSSLVVNGVNGEVTPPPNNDPCSLVVVVDGKKNPSWKRSAVVRNVKALAKGTKRPVAELCADAGALRLLIEWSLDGGFSEGLDALAADPRLTAKDLEPFLKRHSTYRTEKLAAALVGAPKIGVSIDHLLPAMERCPHVAAWMLGQVSKEEPDLNVKALKLLRRLWATGPNPSGNVQEMADELLHRMDEWGFDPFAAPNPGNTSHYYPPWVLEQVVGHPAFPATAHQHSIFLRECAHGNVTTLRKMLLRPDVDPTIREHQPLREACRYLNVDTFRLLLEDGRCDPAFVPLWTIGPNVGLPDPSRSLLTMLGKGERPALMDSLLAVLHLLLEDPRFDPTYGAPDGVGKALQTLLHLGTSSQALLAIAKHPRVNQAAFLKFFCASRGREEDGRLVERLLRIVPTHDLPPTTTPSTALLSSVSSAVSSFVSSPAAPLLDAPSSAAPSSVSSAVSSSVSSPAAPLLDAPSSAAPSSVSFSAAALQLAFRAAVDYPNDNSGVLKAFLRDGRVDPSSPSLFRRLVSLDKREGCALFQRDSRVVPFQPGDLLQALHRSKALTRQLLEDPRADPTQDDCAPVKFAVQRGWNGLLQTMLPRVPSSALPQLLTVAFGTGNAVAANLIQASFQASTGLPLSPTLHTSTFPKGTRNTPLLRKSLPPSNATPGKRQKQDFLSTFLQK